MKQSSWKVFLVVFVLLVSAFLARHSSRLREDSTRKSQSVGSTAVATTAASAVSQVPVAAPPATAEVSSLKPSREVLWQQPMPEKNFAAFKVWTSRYASAKTGQERSALESEGKALAQARLSALADLIKTDPERALALAVPHAIRQEMPASIRALLEEPINTTGDYEVIGFTPLPGHERDTTPVVRFANIQGEKYEAYTYGLGLEFVTKTGVPLNGFAVPANGNNNSPKLLALDPAQARILDSDEIAPIKAAKGDEAICEISGNNSTARGEETALKLGGQTLFFCGVNHASAYVAKKTEELGLTKATKSIAAAPLDIEFSPYTEGRKRILLCRVDFPDYLGEVMSTNSALSSFQTFSNNMAELSYNRLLFARLGQGSYITPTMHLTNTAASLAGDLGALLSACHIGCTAIGIDWNQFDFHFVCTSAKPNASFAGVGYVGGDGFWLANGYWGAGTATHEYGHNLGLNHANYWDTSGNSIIGTGTSIEYGDNFDPMGAAGASPQHYNSRYKNYLGWITNTDCPTITANGTYRVYAHDVAGSATAGVRGLRMVRNANQNYWVDLRQRFNTKPHLNGVGLHWTGNGNQSSLLLDTTPGSPNGINDSTLVIGRTFDDSALGLHITPIGKGNTYPESMDVVINFGNPATNQPPIAIVSASSLVPAVGQSVTFAATATDPNGDALAYSWDFGDNDFSIDNKAVTAHSFASAGEYYVQCTVSDMKGGTALDSVVVRVGSPATFRISGRVLLGNQQPLAGVHIVIDSSHDAFTDTDGTYTITGLSAGSYTVNAILNGYSFAAPFFSSPVTVGPNFTTADFIAIPGSQQIYTPIVTRGSTWRYLDNGTDQGTAWTAAGFNDTSWATGPAVLGYGQGNEATTLSYGADPNNKYITYYFRQAFTVNDPTAFTNALLEVLRDDGVIVYLNGTEIFRDNMPAGPVTSSTFAVASVEPSAYLQTNVSRSLLLPGNNIVTAEIHQSDRTSSDINFDLALSGLSISNASNLQLIYISSPGNNQTFIDPANVTINATALSGGAPVTLVEFYGDGAKLGEAASSPYSAAWSSPALGSHVLKVIATLGSGIQLTSAPVQISIQSPTVPPVSSTLVQAGATWKFYATNAGPTGAWTTLSYNDANWRSGPAELGYGDGGEATIVPFGPDANNKWVTAYFRHVFTINDPGAVTNLLLNLKRDDGAVVYLNGSEVLRDLMAPGPVSWGTLATVSAADDGANFNAFNLNPASLTQGTNVLAVEIHQSAGNSSDMSFDASLLATAASVRSRQVTLLSPTNGAPIALPSDVPFSADAVAGGSLIITQLQFFADGAVVAGDASYPYNTGWSSAPVGSHQVFAVATDSAGDSITSAPVSITVTSPPTSLQLISLGDVWKYLDDGSNQGTNWSKRIFDDHTWMSAPAQFGYGGHGEITTLNYGTNLNARYISAYFRKPFSLGLPSSYSGFLMHLIRDDGIVVYVNGVEVFRNNLLPGLVSWNSLAPTSLDAPEESTPLDIFLPRTLFSLGTNVVAVELHQASITSPDASFDLALTAVSNTNTTQGVYITSPGNNAHYNTPARVAFSSFSQSSAGAVSLVEYFDGLTKIGQAASAPYSLTWSNGAIGTHAVRAVATYGAGLTMTSPPVSVTISTAPPPIAPVFQTLLTSGSSWKYWDSASAVSNDWRNADFDDSAWPAGLARLGWGLDGEATTLTQGRVAHYFRRSFNVANPALLSELTFELIRDDGAVVYLNGVEIFRSNMPPGPVGPATLASTTVDTPDETTWFETILSTAGSGLLTGSNVLAIELHQASTTSSDAGFDLQLFASGTTESRLYLANPIPGHTYSSPGVVPLDAQAWPGTGGSITKVEFYAGSNKLGEATSPPYSTAWYDPAFGNYQITAQATDASGQRMTSAPVNITVSLQLFSSILIPANATWKYLDDGSNQGTGWVTPGFNDGPWKSGPAQLGYADGDETTVVNSGPTNAHYITTYFRKSFITPSNTVITNLTFNLVRDDGAVVYLNGQEMYRSNMPNGTITYLTLAPTSVGNADESAFFTSIFSITNLPAGTNIVAVEIHQQSATSSDISFALELSATGYSLPVAVPPPSLSIIQTNGSLFLRWPATATGYNLYGADTLGGTWNSLNPTLGTTNGQKVATISPTAPTQFYRLRRP